MNRSVKLLMGILGMSAGLPQAHAWGHRGHAVVAGVGARLAVEGGDFWQANADSLAELTNVPDRLWKRGQPAAREKPTHWFQIDSYFKDESDYANFPHSLKTALADYGASAVAKNGTAPWRIEQFRDLAVQSLRRGDFATALEMAGVMSHYVGDLSQPLHVSENYDGQMTDNVGIHKFFESDNIEERRAPDLEAEVETEARRLLASSSFRAHFGDSFDDAIFLEVERAHLDKDAILQIDSRQGRGAAGAKAQLLVARRRLADGAASLALLLGEIWHEAGSPSRAGASVKVDLAPSWVAPDFLDATVNEHDLGAYLGRDDCF